MKQKEKQEKRRAFGWHALEHLLEASGSPCPETPEIKAARGEKLWHQLHPEQSDIPQYDGFEQGTVLRKRWRGQWYQLTVTPDGFQHEGQVFKTLSGAANHITGGQRNGKAFFGVNHGN